MASISALLFVAFLSTLLPLSFGRYIIVGSDNPIEPWTEAAINYTQWEIDNPLYVGDVAVFKYRAYYHVVWRIPNIEDYNNCVYDRAEFIGNDTAGVGDGFLVPVTDQPQYLVCGVFGHCELGQKVIINGSLGALPPSLIGVDVPPSPPPSPPYVPPPPVFTNPPLVLAFPPFDTSSPPPPSKLALQSPPPPASTASPSPTASTPSGAVSLAPAFLSVVMLAISVMLLR